MKITVVRHHVFSISAKTGVGIDKLLEILALETQILELKANPEGMAPRSCY